MIRKTISRSKAILLALLFCYGLVMTGVVLYDMRKRTVIHNQERAVHDRNAKRKRDIRTINGLFFKIGNDEEVLSQIPYTDIEICKYGVTDCGELLDLATIVNSNGMPFDEASPDPNATGYAIRKGKMGNPVGSKTHTVTVTSLHAEDGEVIVYTY